MPFAHRTLAIALASLSLLATPTLAEERWYQVELLVFSNENSTAVEQWDPLPQLSYPDRSRFLVYPAQLESRLDEFPGESEVNEFGRQRIVMPPESDPDAQEENAEDATTTAVAEVQDPNEPLIAESSVATDFEPEQLYPTPFIALPHSQREFHGKSAYMQRTGKYRTLFHETWVQPMQAEDSAIPLVLDPSGDIENWPRLQGSVTLHIARYLHIQTNLWLNTAGEYLPGDWRMPAPPLGPVSLVVEYPEPVLPQVPEEEALPLSYAEPLPLMEDPQDPNAINGELIEEGPVYPWRHAVAFKQKRRMRSNEVHYLDHPLVGLVIKFTPLDDETLHEMGLAELGAASAALAPAN